MGPCGPLHNDPIIHEGRAKNMGNAEDHEDRNANLADQGEDEQDAAINEVDDPPENEYEVPTLADEAKSKDCLIHWQHKTYLRHQNNQNVA